METKIFTEEQLQEICRGVIGTENELVFFNVTEDQLSTMLSTGATCAHAANEKAPYSKVIVTCEYLEYNND